MVVLTQVSLTKIAPLDNMLLVMQVSSLENSAPWQHDACHTCLFVSNSAPRHNLYHWGHKGITVKGALVGKEGDKGSAAVAFEGEGVQGFVIGVGMPGLPMLGLPLQLLW